MTIEAMLTMPWTQKKKDELLTKTGRFTCSDPIELSRTTSSGAKEQLEFRVDVAMIYNGKCAVILHCFKGKDITVRWSYKKEGSEEWSVVDKVTFVKPDIHEIGNFKQQKFESGGALHIQTVSSAGNLFALDRDSDCLLVQLKIEEKDRKEDDALISIQEDIIRDLNNMLTSSDTADIHLVCQGKKFPCHRSLLAARSSVFKTMFFGQGDYKEGKDGQVIIEEFQPDEVEQFLSFVYSGDCDFSQVDPWQILELADKYDVPMLNRICCQVSSSY